MIFSPYALYDELLSQKFTSVFKLLSKNDRNLKIEVLLKDNPRNVIFSIIFENKEKYLFKQAKIHTISSLEPFENEAIFYRVFFKENIDFFYNQDKKYLIFPWIDSVNISYMAFFENSILLQKFYNDFVNKTFLTINIFHENCNLESLKKTFLKKTFSSIEPAYINFLKLYRKAYISDNFESLLFSFESNKDVRLLITDFLKRKRVAQFLLNLQDKFTSDYLIHGDLTVNNIRGKLDNNSLQVIDFEFVCLGDKIWDYVTFTESVFENYFQFSYSDIYNYRFTLLIDYLKENNANDNVSFNKNEIKKYVYLLIIYKLRFLIEFSSKTNSAKKANPEKYAKTILDTVQNLIEEHDEFINYILEGRFEENVTKFLRVPECNV